MTISGKPGLYRMVAQGKGGFIVEDLAKGKKTSVSTQNNVSLLDNISIYTYTAEISLAEIFTKITLKEKKIESDNLEKYFAELIPNYDKERVYLSDLKKIYRWYNILQSAGMIELPTEEEKVKKESKKPVTKKPAAKKAAAKKKD